MTGIHLPAFWQYCPLGDIANLVTKGTTPTTAGFNYQSSGIRFVKVENIDRFGINKESITEFISDEAHKALARSQFCEGDVLFSIAGTIGKTALVDSDVLPANTNQAVAIIRGLSGVFLPEFLKYQLKRSAVEIQKANARGGAMNNISLGDLKASMMLVSPLAEQKVIADKLDTLLAQVDNTKARLERIPEILKSFRQSVLAAAVSGKLTEEWREKHVFEVNSAEIARKHEKYFLDTKNKYQIPSGFNLNGASLALPSSWRWYRAEQLCDLITKGTTPAKENMSSNGEIPYIKVYNLTFDGSLDFSIEPTFVPSSIHNQDLKRSKVFPGDVLMNIVGPPLGKVSVVPDTYPEWNINQAICIFRPVCGVSNQYLSLCLRDEGLLELTKAKAKATAGQFNLTLEICRDYSLPIPPAEEQTEIVRRVEELFAYADRIEQAAQAAQSRVSNLTQSILAKAFRGELTAEWRAANLDLISGANSAEALLAKIKAERAKLSKKTKAKA